jgi:hypothetical protein
MSIITTIILCTSTLIICIILAASLYYIYSKANELTKTLMDHDQCNASDTNGKSIFSSGGVPYTPNGPFDEKFCIFNPLFLTDVEFRESALMLYTPSQIITAFIKILNGSYQLPSSSLIQQDPVLANMILNPWFTSDTPFNVTEKITYNKSLNSFVLNGEEYNNFSNSGINLSSYVDKKTRETNYYLFMDNKVILELPIQLYIQKLPAELRGNQKVKSGGVWKTVNVDPINIVTVDNLHTVLEHDFYQFKDRSGFKTCQNRDSKEQKDVDSTCKFFSADSLSGLIVALKRILVINLPDNVIADYIEYVNIKISNGTRITYMEFFLWLAMKSHRDKVTYDFQMIK